MLFAGPIRKTNVRAVLKRGTRGGGGGRAAIRRNESTTREGRADAVGRHSKNTSAYRSGDACVTGEGRGGGCLGTPRSELPGNKGKGG